MVVQLVPGGLLFGADRNVTTSLSRGNDVLASGQSEHPKVLKWPNHETVVGYVGRATVGDMQTDEWLYDFIGRNLHADRGQLTHSDLEQLAYELKRRLEFDLGRYGSVADSAMVLRLGGFVEDAGQWKPEIWHVRNATAGSGYRDTANEFDVFEGINSEFADLTGDEIQAQVVEMAQIWRPYWFHEGYDLETFNTLEQVLRAGMKLLIENSSHPFPDSLPYPDSLKEWSKHLKMAILTYGSYFGAFYEPFQQFVGGGVDVVWAARPLIPPIP
jgi:hypothetical protein